MMKQQQQVHEFHAATGARIGDLGWPRLDNIALRLDLMLEELKEIGQATGFYLTEYPDGGVEWDDSDFGDDPPPKDLIAAIDGLGDLLYVLLGAAVEWGIDLQPYFDEIHASNMTKVGGPVRADGKRLKPAGYRPPNLREVFNQQLEDYAKRCKNPNCACRAAQIQIT